ncbi:MAG: hypothetical protein ACD_58C00042G0004 [uncultured bacterium]|nr:MAG: hypothetical protein ACD_58C00042G0004 [uncultured bacterium]
MKKVILLDVICDLNNLLNKLQDYIRRPRRRTKKHIYSWQVFDRYSDLIIILLRIDDNLKKAKRYDQIFLKYDKNKEYKKANKLFSASIQVSKEIQFDIKILYMWVHQIKNTFIEINKNRKNTINLNELNRMSLIRNKFIEHISDYDKKDKNTGKTLSPFTKSHQMPYGGFALGQYKNPSIFFQDIMREPKKKKYKRQLSLLTNRIKKCLPDIDKQINDLDKVNFIYENLLLIPKVYKNDAIDLINKVGARTDSPLKIAQELFIILEKYIKSV